MVIFTSSPSEPSKSLAFPYLLILFSIPFCTFSRTFMFCDAAPSSPPVISWENLGVFLRCELLESEVLPCSSGDMLAGLLCPLTWFRRLQRWSKTTSTTEKRWDLRASGRFGREEKNVTGSDYRWNACNCIAVDGGACGCEGSLLQMRDLGICFTLDPGPAVIALQLGRWSWSSPSVWNNQPEALKVLPGYWGITFVNVTSQRCDNPLWHFLLQKYKRQNRVSSHLLPVPFNLSHFAGKAQVVQCSRYWWI